MSNFQVHVFFENDPHGPTACGGLSYGFGATTDRSEVTCKRCLASLAKRDREFQRKARRWWGFPAGRVIERAIYMRSADWPLTSWKGRENAARAIAREEGRAP
jgi:hypothetical protein